MVLDLSITFFSLMWFHEFTKGGPHEPDNLYGNYLLTSVIGYLGLAGLAGWAIAKDDSYPLSGFAHVFLVVNGLWFSYRLKEIHHQDD